MGLSIFLRTNKNVSYFRRNLLKLIKLPFSDRLVLCSGYISEGSYYSILNDRLLDAIVSNCKEVITVAGHFFFPVWEERYLRFVRKLRSSGVILRAYKARRKNWHAKVAIKLKDDIPIAALIGSSNLTRPAYLENYTGFNHEADVLIWKDMYEYNDYFRDYSEFEMKDKTDDPFKPIYAMLDKKFKQSNESERLKAIYKMIINKDFLIPFEENK